VKSGVKSKQKGAEMLLVRRVEEGGCSISPPRPSQTIEAHTRERGLEGRSTSTHRRSERAVASYSKQQVSVGEKFDPAGGR
jgi:hypothetical protein